MATFTHWLVEQPIILIVFLIEAILLFGVVVLPWLLRPLVSRLGTEAQSKDLYDSYKTIISFTGVVLAFLLIQAHGNFRAAEELTVKEATAITSVDRAMLRHGDPRMAALRPGLQAYGRAIVSEEWPLMATGGHSVTVDSLYTATSRPARTLDPQTAREQAIFTEIVRGLDEVWEFREARINANGLGLPPLFWNALGAMFVLLFGIAALISPQADYRVSLGGIIAAVGLLFALVVMVDEPFRGENSVRPYALERALPLMVARQ
jgi:hypothetical protein